MTNRDIHESRRRRAAQVAALQDLTDRHLQSWIVYRPEVRDHEEFISLVHEKLDEHIRTQFLYEIEGYGRYDKQLALFDLITILTNWAIEAYDWDTFDHFARSESTEQETVDLWDKLENGYKLCPSCEGTGKELPPDIDPFEMGFEISPKDPTCNVCNGEKVIKDD